MSKKRKGNLLIVDGFALERASMTALLANEKNIDKIYEASGLEEAKTQIESKKISLIIFSMISLDQDELSLLAEINALAVGLPIMVLGPDNQRDNMLTIMDLGVRGYVTKNENREVLLEGIRQMLEGEEYFPGVNEKKLKQQVIADKSIISGREKEILRLVIGGMNNVRIGEELSISVRTVENHRANMMRKLNVKNTAELVKTAITEQLVDY